MRTCRNRFQPARKECRSGAEHASGSEGKRGERQQETRDTRNAAAESETPGFHTPLFETSVSCLFILVRPAHAQTVTKKPRALVRFASGPLELVRDAPEAQTFLRLILGDAGRLQLTCVLDYVLRALARTHSPS